MWIENFQSDPKYSNGLFIFQAVINNIKMRTNTNIPKITQLKIF